MTQWITHNIKNQYLASLKEALKIPSYLKSDKSSYPFGLDIQKSLEHAIDTAKKIGFKTFIDPEGYYGYADIGEGKELIGILGHLDVVAPGNIDNWEHDPFDPFEKNGKLFARGVQDDKGPIYSTMFAIKSLVDQQITFNKRIRIIFGTDEETLWRCIKKYLKNEEIPSMSFTPDSSFPLVQAEKGLLQCKISLNDTTNRIPIKGGDSINAVCDKVSYYGEKQSELIEELKKLKFQYEQQKDHVNVIGKSAHAKSTQKGINAIGQLAIALKNINIKNNLILFLAERVGETFYGEKIFGVVHDEMSGRLHFNVGKINTLDSDDIFVDIRIPVINCNIDLILDQLKITASQYNLNVQEHDRLNSIYLPISHDLIKTLLNSYIKISGDKKSKPIAMGGATYARAISNCVAFGPMFPNSIEVAHQPNEFIVLEDIFKAMEIYADAILNLTKKK